MASEAKPSPVLIWQGADLPRVSPGDYQAVCTGWQGPEWVRAFRRWSIRLEFSLLAENARISNFLNMGNDPTGPRIGRRSRFYEVWCQANGEPPQKGQQMALETLTDPSLIYTVRVADATRDAKDDLKPDALVYSRVTDILKVERP